MASRKPGWIVWIVLALALLVAAAAGVYAWTWFHYARQLESVAQKNLAALRTDGRQADCPRMATSGFPLAMRISCASFRYRDPKARVAVETGPVESAAALYDPLTLTGSVVGPGMVALPDAPALHFTWQTLTADTRLAQPLPEHVALSGTDIVASLQKGGEAMVRAATLALAARPVGKDLDLAFDFSGLALDESLAHGVDLPPLDGALDVRLARGVAMLVRPPRDLRGLSAKISKASLSSGDAALELSGPVKIRANGLIDARLSITIRKPQEIAALLGDALPQKRDQIETAFSALAMLGDGASLPLRIDGGKAYIGFIKVGDIPPVE